MRHVSDGDLHAYLDGALDVYPGADAQRVRSHLEACEECRRRLEEEARVREAAADVLARTGPASVEVPPFEELRRRSAVAAGAATGRRGPGLGTTLGWAASVVLALGVGWMVGQGSGSGEGALLRGEPRAPAGSAGTGTAREAVDQARLADAAAPPAGDVAPSAEAQGEAVGVSADRRVADAAVEAQAAEERVAAAVAAPEESPAGAPEGAAAAPGDPTPTDTDSVATILGRAVREGSGAPLVGATVRVAGTSVGSLTDQEGRYVLSGVPPGSRTLQLHSIGYEPLTEPVTVAAGDTAVVDLSTPVAAIALENVVVSGVARGDPAAPRPELVDSLAGARRVLDSIAARPGFLDSLAARRRPDSLVIAPTVFTERTRADTPVPAAALRTAPGERDALRGDSLRSDSLRAARRLPAEVHRAGEPGETARALAIPGLEVLRVSWTEVAPGVEGLVVVQRLAADTARLELRFGGLHRDARGASADLSQGIPADPSAGAPGGGAVPAALLEERLPDGVSQVSAALRRGGWVVLRGRLPADRLRRLLDLVR